MNRFRYIYIYIKRERDCDINEEIKKVKVREEKRY